MIKKDTTQETTTGAEKMKTKYIVIANGQTFEFTTRCAARYWAEKHNTKAVRVNIQK